MNARRLISLGLPRTGSFMMGLLIAVLQGLSAVALLASSAWLISRASEQPNIVFVSVAVVGVRAFAVGRAAFRYGERMVLHNAAFKMLTLQRPKFFARLIPFAPVALARDSRGQAISRVVTDVDELQNLSLRVISPLLQSLLVSLAAAFFLGLFVPLAGVALLVACGFALVVAIPLASRVARNSEAALVTERAELAELSLDLIENAEVLSAYGWHSDELDRLARVEARMVAKQKLSSFSSGFVQATFTLLAVLATVATAWFGAEAVVSGDQPGVMLAVFALLPMAVFDVLNSSQSISQSWQKYRASAERLLQLLDKELPAEVPFETDLEAKSKLQLDGFESLEFRNVSATYPGSRSTALHDCSFRLSRGERLLVSGESGAGKSTISNLMLRFLNQSSGRVLVNGRDIGDFSIESIRSVIGLIEQQPTVFFGTVRQNLLIAKPNATDAELIEVLQRVSLWSKVENRGGLDLFVGERASLLSGGEAARLAMARALLAEFQLLILDEPTANLDAETAAKTMYELIQVAQQSSISVILISHDKTMGGLTTSAIEVEKSRDA